MVFFALWKEETTKINLVIQKFVRNVYDPSVNNIFLNSKRLLFFHTGKLQRRSKISNKPKIENCARAI